MEQIVQIIIEYFMNSLEEFFSAIRFPTQAYTRKAFFVSLGFLVASVVLEVFEIGVIVHWDTALTCSVLLGIVSLLDATTRASAVKAAKQLNSKVSSGVGKIKSAVVANQNEDASYDTYSEEPTETEYESKYSYTEDYVDENCKEDGSYYE